jgi:hypothetical protein
MVVTLISTRNSAVDTLVEETLRGAREAGLKEIDASKKPQNELRKVAHIDYVRVIRRTLNYRALLAILSEAQVVLPQLNRKQIWPQLLDEVFAIAGDLQIHLQVTARPEPEGVALRGFYVDNGSGLLKHPLIYLNSAHHPSAVSTTFLHELGHFLTANATKHADNDVHYFFNGAHHSHLGEPEELAADVLVSLAVYPEPLARRIFAMPWKWGLVARANELNDRALGLIREHLWNLGGIDLSASRQTGQRFSYVTRMIHYAKLRWALLLEYDL